MKVNLRSAALLGTMIASLQSCTYPRPPFPQRIDENEYLFLIIEKDAEIAVEKLIPATDRATAFCGQLGREHIVNVEPKTILEGRREMSAYYFSCCKAQAPFVEPTTEEEMERYLDNPPSFQCE